MARRSLAAVFVFLAVLLWISPQAGATGNYEVTRVLGELRSLNDSDFAQVVTWARTTTLRPTFVFTPAQAAENNILALHPANRDPILSWLRGHGRSALYALLLTDADVGPRRAGVDGGQIVPPAVAISPWRELTLATGTLGAQSAGDIQIVAGFAAAKKDGTGATACITFRNLSAKNANRIVVEFPLMNADAAELGVLTLDRRGTFSPNIDIAGYATIADLSGNTIGPRGRSDNCASLSTGVAAIPILSARYASYRLTRVEYTDGTVWTPPAGAGR